MSLGPILVVNPNSDAAVTAGIDAALAPFRLAGGPAIDCVTNAEGPRGVESEADAAVVVPQMLRLVAERPDAAALVVACYSDPGLEALREATGRPVFGMQTAGVLAAMARADLFGVIALSEASVLRHRRHLRAMGVLGRLAAERPLGLGVAESGGAAAAPRLLEVGRALVAEGAGAVVLGCAGMAPRRGWLEAELGAPVIEPTQAAVAQALGAVLARSA